MPNQVTKCYSNILKRCNNLGIKVHHTTSKKYCGRSFSSQNLIRMANKYKNTLYGCYVLAHELGHQIDYRLGRMVRFFDNTLPRNEQIEEIRKVEWSATKFGEKIIKSHALSVKRIKDIDKQYFEESLMPLWIKFYIDENPAQLQNIQ